MFACSIKYVSFAARGTCAHVMFLACRRVAASVPVRAAAMPSNVEIKAKLEDRERTVRKAKELSGSEGECTLFVRTSFSRTPTLPTWHRNLYMQRIRARESQCQCNSVTLTFSLHCRNHSESGRYLLQRAKWKTEGTTIQSLLTHSTAWPVTAILSSSQLRVEDGVGKLISYSRADVAGPKLSKYSIAFTEVGLLPCLIPVATDFTPSFPLDS